MNNSLWSRRSFLGNVAFTAAASAVLSARGFLDGQGWLEAATAAPADLVHQTFNGLFAFVVPGPDEYSVAQGASTTEPGGLDAGAVEAFLTTLDQSTPLPNFSGIVAATLNGLAQQVNPTATTPFDSPFANLSYVEKAVVFSVIDSIDQLKLLGGLLPLFVAYFCYSEAGVLDPATRTLTGHPIGWQLSHYTGVSDGRAEFLGYFRNRRGN